MTEKFISSTSAIRGPHRAIPAADKREELALELFDVLWDRYRERVSYVADYENVIAQAGATFVNDHIAFRTFAAQEPLAGIFSVSRIFEALGYVPAGAYHFPDKHLDAVHFQHPNPQFPKIFVSELRLWALSAAARDAISRTLKSHRDPLSEETLSALANVARETDKRRGELLDVLVGQFHELPWNVPRKEDVVAVNKESQYAAWVLVHGYNVNHFTSLINSHGVEALDDIEKTIDALKRAGVPMKAEIEGTRGSKLRQSATEAAVIDVTVSDNGQETTTPWTYAYFELAERNVVTDPETGVASRFEGFLGPQATHLFEMTKVKGS